MRASDNLSSNVGTDGGSPVCLCRRGTARVGALHKQDMQDVLAVLGTVKSKSVGTLAPAWPLSPLVLLLFASSNT